MKLINYVILSVLIFAIGCNNDNAPKKIEDATHGNIKISVDDSYKLIVDANLYVFEALYKYAIVNVNYKTEHEALKDFMNDSVKTIIVSKKLTTTQENHLKKQNIIVRTTRIAKDAVCFVVNKENIDSELLYDEINGIFNGKITKWTDINKNSKLGNIEVVFDNEGSSNVSYIQEKFNINKFPNYCLSANSNAEVIDYVEKNKNAIGLISASWISDPYDTTSNSFLEKINVVGVSMPNQERDKDTKFYKPYQAYIADASYPLRREVFAICRESFVGLGSGFISFIAGEQGQRIILKSGMVPGTMPIRLVELKN